MKVTVTKRHINAAKLSEGKRTPVELAIMEMDCFEEIGLKPEGANGFILEIDGMFVSLPRKVQNGIRKFNSTYEMNPISFDLPLENDLMFTSDDMLFEPFEDSFDYGYGF